MRSSSRVCRSASSASATPSADGDGQRWSETRGQQTVDVLEEEVEAEEERGDAGREADRVVARLLAELVGEQRDDREGHAPQGDLRPCLVVVEPALAERVELLRLRDRARLRSVGCLAGCPLRR